jgi:hypothetical protein
MTKRLPPNPDGLNRHGNGKGLKVVAKPQPKKRGQSAAKMPVVVADNRSKYVDVSALPRHEIAESVDPNKPLTEKAKLFVKFWAQGESITSASARAGYGDGATYAYRLVHYPQVKALYAEEKRLYEESCQMTRKKVMDGLLEGIEMAKLAGEPASVITGWKTVGQMCGYFEPVKRTLDINVTGNVTMQQMSKLSDAELLRMIQQGVQHDLEQLAHSGDDGDSD